MDLLDLDTFDPITIHQDTTDLDTSDLHMGSSLSLLDDFERSLKNSMEPADRARMEASLAEHRSVLSTIRSVPRRSMAKALPPETLTLISIFLDVGSIRSYRLVCRGFEKAAWPAFSKTFNGNIFYPTEESLKALKELAKNSTFVPYLKQLKIGAIKVIPAGPKVTRGNMALFMRDYPNEPTVPQNPGQVQWILEREGRMRLADMLRTALTKLVCVETLCIVNWDAKRPFELPAGTSCTEWDVDLKAHRYALDIVYNAIQYMRTSTNHSSFLPNFRKFRTEGQMTVSALPGCSCRAPIDVSKFQRDCVLPFTQITHLDLAITNKLRSIDCEEMTRLVQFYLPNFLASMPNVTNLSVQFDRGDYRTPQPHRPQELRNIKECFEAVADSVRLPQLTTLHLSYLSLTMATPLLDFLFKHRATLKSLKLTILTLPFVEWRPFVRFLAKKIDLEDLTMASDMSPEEREASAKGWLNVPEDLDPRSEDYRRVCKNGMRFLSKYGEKELVRAVNAES